MSESGTPESPAEVRLCDALIPEATIAVSGPVQVFKRCLRTWGHEGGHITYVGSFTSSYELDGESGYRETR